MNIFLGDMKDILQLFPENHFDSVVTDPPYHLDSIVKRFGSKTAAPAKHGTDGAFKRASSGFMGQSWDNDIMRDPEAWAAVYRVLKPGGHMLAFSHARTYHRMVTAIEDVGFEIRDQIMWLYGSGFPKAHDLGDGWKTALKPAHEPICVARKPISERTVKANFEIYGTGGLNIDGCRVQTDDVIKSQSNNNITGDAYNSDNSDRERDTIYNQHDKGRFPANVITDGSQEVIDSLPVTKGAGAVKGTEKSKLTNTCYGEYKERFASPALPGGSAARFFYSAKANKTDRAGSKHPTVKPQSLMRYLCRLITPPGGTILDPFAGSGSTLEAAFNEGFKSVGVEMTPEYYEDIKNRIGKLK